MSVWAVFAMATRGYNTVAVAGDVDAEDVETATAKGMVLFQKNYPDADQLPRVMVRGPFARESGK